MARKDTEELKSAELKNKVQTVKKSLEEQQHRNNREVQQTVQEFQAGEEARTIAAKDAVESKSREAEVETNRERGC